MLRLQCIKTGCWVEVSGICVDHQLSHINEKPPTRVPQLSPDEDRRHLLQELEPFSLGQGFYVKMEHFYRSPHCDWLRRHLTVSFKGVCKLGFVPRRLFLL